MNNLALIKQLEDLKAKFDIEQLNAIIDELKRDREEIYLPALNDLKLAKATFEGSRLRLKQKEFRIIKTDRLDVELLVFNDYERTFSIVIEEQGKFIDKEFDLNRSGLKSAKQFILDYLNSIEFGVQEALDSNKKILWY